MQTMDKIVVRQGKTLNLSSRIGRHHRSHRQRCSGQGRRPQTNGGSRHPRHIQDFATFIQQLKNIQATEEEQSRPCHFVVEQAPERAEYYGNIFFASYSM
jgi:hypothetical protein